MIKNESTLIPYVIESSSNGERQYDLFSRLLKDRIVMITGEVTESSMAVASGELLFLDSLDSSPIYMYINSPGGSVVAGLGGLMDTMNFINSPVYTFALGEAASMGAAILSAGEPGHRYAMRSSQILVHQLSNSSGGDRNVTMAESTVDTNHSRRLSDYLYSTIAYNCKQISKEAYEEICKAVKSPKLDDRKESLGLSYSRKTKAAFDKFKKNNNFDHWMFSDEALKFGIIDKILTSKKELEEELLKK